MASEASVVVRRRLISIKRQWLNQHYYFWPLVNVLESYTKNYAEVVVCNLVVKVGVFMRVQSLLLNLLLSAPLGDGGRDQKGE